MIYTRKDVYKHNKHDKHEPPKPRRVSFILMRVPTDYLLVLL